MELRHLRYFVAVAEELHFRRAAERLHIAQPPLSQQIQALEEEVGAQLLIRSRRSVSLTEAGEIFLQRARRVLEDAAAASTEARRMAKGELGHLRVGYTTSLPLKPLLPSILGEFRKKCPDVTVQLREMVTPEQFDSLRNNELDIGFVRYNEPDRKIDGLRLTLLSNDPLMMAMPVRHPLANAEQVTLAQFADERFISYPANAGADLGVLVRRLCNWAGFSPKVEQEAAEAVTQIGLVAAGLGVTVMPSPMACIAMDRVRYVPLADAGAFHSMYLVTRDGLPKPLLANFLSCVDVAVAFSH
ncbi:MAG: LysR family transcriptional regulator [Candidatus Dactylopiibacterium carminicum]|uniref:LysR family transcriptional regulator n=1 Tax=Candidatus Dactylopiibacterium carminicum TaxID=857335 RepID=A0A272EVX6_9RHOO|nr:LysR substrate-binding domain-containing protein [Candidatus Dactylopiibacterium carminicum]KAF7599616.1 LysR family transcriptional regulator [Candidatus Dactylopiibacterium carminicum]PAS94263.1 MAG: LysR family transcriptional regulator [Candidatus Dactylopiibacterium carminicum]PAS99619.1 MAG: LysR family transcriptional regulator [Candidatus Dactylopiibacterium carminicum]